jgi:hypothetical protein
VFSHHNCPVTHTHSATQTRKKKSSEERERTQQIYLSLILSQENPPTKENVNFLSC